MIQFSIKLRDDLYLRSDNGKISIKISPENGNALTVEKDGLYVEDKCGLNDDGFVDQVSDNLRIGFNGPFTKMKDSGEYPNPGVISADSTIHRIYTMNSDLKTIDGYRRVDCILPGDIIRVPIQALEEEAEQEEYIGIGAMEEAAEIAQQTIAQGVAISSGFVQRTTVPEAGNKFYITKDAGGYSMCIVGTLPHTNGLNVLCNCVGYAWGRFHEVSNDTDFKYIHGGNPPPIYQNVIASGKMQVGSEPRPGALIIWQKSYNAGSGHIGFVEAVTNNGQSIVTSESGYSSFDFKSKPRENDGNWGAGSDYKFIGFIYHPSVSASFDQGGTMNAQVHYVPINPTVYTVEQKSDGCYYVEDILIVNKTYPLPKDYNPGENKEALEALSQMQKAAKSDGINIDHIASSFRSYQSQKTIYENYAKSEKTKNNVTLMEGYLEADYYSARPGHSEHQTGLAFDVFTSSRADNGCPEMKWLVANCWKYGFINRYPTGKQDITGYMREDWHVRYVGKEWAKKIYESGLCFEEYFGLPSKYVTNYDSSKS